MNDSIDKKWELGQTSKKYESGGKGASTISTGQGDHGGVSYGTYQLSSKMGTLQDFVSKNYSEEFKGLTVNSEEYKTKWRELAKSDENFGTNQHEYIKETHYDVQLNKLKNKGVDLSERGNAIQDMIWSTATQMGPDTERIYNALKHYHGEKFDITNISDAEIINSVQNYKVLKNEVFFRSSSDKVRSGTLD